jgi:CheY-like chemotaxis protein
MSKQEQKKLFQSFTQADSSTTRKYGGTGLGLSISKQLVKLMGGKIWVESELGKGSIFIFELPLPKGDASKVSKDKNVSIADISYLRGSILLVDDSKINQEIIIGLLENSDINIDIANNGKEAVDRFKSNKNRYELIFMDIQMPVMDGYEATKLIKEIDKNIPIIALTANALKEDIQKTKHFGMQEHLNKPVEVEKLYAVLLKYISKKVNNKELNDKTLQKDIDIPVFYGIDTKVGLSHMAENKKLYIKILKDFYSNYKDLRLEELNDEELKRTAHTIKGLSANIGANDLTIVSKELEDTLNKNLFDKFYNELNKVLNELKTIGNTNKNLKPIDDKTKEKLFNSIKEYAKKRKAREIRKTIQKLHSYILEDSDKKALDKIEMLLGKRDYKSIVILL